MDSDDRFEIFFHSYSSILKPFIYSQSSKKSRSIEKLITKSALYIIMYGR